MTFVAIVVTTVVVVVVVAIVVAIVVAVIVVVFVLVLEFVWRWAVGLDWAHVNWLVVRGIHVGGRARDGGISGHDTIYEDVGRRNSSAEGD